MAGSKSERAEALAKELKQTLAKRRPRPWKPVLAALLLSSLTLAGLVWWLYPRAYPETLEIVALDGVFTVDETPIATAQLFAPPADEGTRSLGGHKILFATPPLLMQGAAKPREMIEISDAHGRASVPWSEPARVSLRADEGERMGVKEEFVEFTARYLSTEPRPKNVNDGGRLFIWPKNVRVLLVDADETLIADKLDDKAAAALTKSAADGWRIIYLTPAAATAYDWRIARGWIARQANLPIGPVLGRRQFPSDDAVGPARQALLQSLPKFDGPKVAVVKSADAERACREAGVRAIVIGNGVGWADVVERLK